VPPRGNVFWRRGDDSLEGLDRGEEELRARERRTELAVQGGVVGIDQRDAAILGDCFFEVAHREEEEHRRAGREESLLLEGIGAGELRRQRVGFDAPERPFEDADEEKIRLRQGQVLPRLFALSQEPESFRSIQTRGDEVRMGFQDLPVSAEGPLELRFQVERDGGLERAPLLGREDRRE
jgi:hypothetical protein